MLNIREIDMVILCGGLGKRLRSVDGETPKVLVDINERPFLDILLEYLKSAGFRRIILCTGYKGELVEEYYKSNSQGLDIEFSKEDEPLGTGGAVRNAQSLIKSDPFIAINGDVFCAFDYVAFIKDFYSKPMAAQLAVALLDENKDFGSITLADSNRILKFNEKQAAESTCNVNVGIYCFSHEVFSTMPQEGNFSLEYDVFPKLVEKEFFGSFTDEEFIDIGTPDRYKQALEILKKKTHE